MALHKFSPGLGGTQRKRRVGRGIGSGMGKTATRGTKGQKARRQVHPNFEGGQTPIQRRAPVKKGFRNINKKEFAIVNLDDLQNLFEDGATVTPDALYATGIVSARKDGVKVLAFGELSKKLTVHAQQFSETAKAAIEAKGGEAVVLELRRSKLPEGTVVEKLPRKAKKARAREAKAAAEAAATSA
jgi:large subunit ribosomal protein L15